MHGLPSVFVFPIIAAGVVVCTNSTLAAQVRIGGVDAIERELEGVFSGDRWNKKAKGDDVYVTEFVRTNEESKAQFSLVDRTGVQIGPMTTIRFDQVVYNPNNSIKGIAISTTLGAARFSSGRSSAYLIRTPQADIYPRGTAFDVFVEDKKTTAVLRAGKISVCLSGARSNCRLVSRPGDMVVITSEIEGPRRGGPSQSDFANRCLSASRQNCVITASYSPPSSPNRGGRSASRPYSTQSALPSATTPAIQNPTVIAVPRVIYRGYRHRGVGTYYQRSYRPCCRTPVYRTPTYRVPTYRVPTYRVPTYRVPTYRVPTYRVPTYRSNYRG